MRRILPIRSLVGSGVDFVARRRACDNRSTPAWSTTWVQDQEDTMGKTGRKRRGRKKKAANHGKRPNA